MDPTPTERPPFRVRLSRKAKLALWLVGLLVIGLPVTWGFYKGWARGQIEVRLDAIAKAGEPVLISDLASPEIPDDENGAFAIERAWAFLAEYEATHERPVALQYAASEWSPTDRDAIRGFIADLETFFDEIEKGLSAPSIRYHPYPAEGFAWPDLPDTRSVRIAVQLHCARAVLLSDDGAWDRTETALCAAFDLSRSVPPRALEFESFGALQERLAALTLRDLAGSNPAGLAMQTTGLQSRLGREHVDGFGQLVRAHRAGSMSPVLALVGSKRLDLSGRHFEFDEPMRPLRWLAPPGAVVYLDDVGDLLAGVHVTHLDWAQAMAPIGRRVDAGWQSWDRYLHWFEQFRLNELVLALRLTAECDARLRLARVALAVARHREDVGSWPPSLDAVSGKDGALLDPFTGKPFLYHRTETGVRIESAGPADTALWFAGDASEEYRLDNALIWDLNDPE